jgi:hypothetical protein
MVLNLFTVELFHVLYIVYFIISIVCSVGRWITIKNFLVNCSRTRTNSFFFWCFILCPNLLKFLFYWMSCLTNVKFSKLYCLFYYFLFLKHNDAPYHPVFEELKIWKMSENKEAATPHPYLPHFSRVTAKAAFQLQYFCWIRTNKTSTPKETFSIRGKPKRLGNKSEERNSKPWKILTWKNLKKLRNNKILLPPHSNRQSKRVNFQSSNFA